MQRRLRYRSSGKQALYLTLQREYILIQFIVHYILVSQGPPSLALLRQGRSTFLTVFWILGACTTITSLPYLCSMT